MLLHKISYNIVWFDMILTWYTKSYFILKAKSYEQKHLVNDKV